MTEPEVKKTPTKVNPSIYKRRAIRFARISEMHKLEKQEPQTPEIKARHKCLSCMWHYDCDEIKTGGCEEFET